MRAQASIEFSLIFTFAFVFFIILLGIVTTTFLGLGDTRSTKASSVLDTVAIYASSLERLGPTSEAVISFDVPNGTLPGSVFEVDPGSSASPIALNIVDSGTSLGSRTNLSIELVPSAGSTAVSVDGEHRLTYRNGVLELA